MKAQVGDRLVVADDAERTGVVIGLKHPDGSPPYVVRWLNGGHIALVLPGPYARIIPAETGHWDGPQPGGPHPAGPHPPRPQGDRAGRQAEVA